MADGGGAGRYYVIVMIIFLSAPQCERANTVTAQVPAIDYFFVRRDEKVDLLTAMALALPQIKGKSQNFWIL